MRILVLTWPTRENDDLLLNARRDHVCPAIDGIVDELIKSGSRVVYVNLAAEFRNYSQRELALTAGISELPFYRWSDIKDREFDLIWHAIKDPTPPQAIPFVERVRRDIDSRVPVFNDVLHARHHTKRKYLSVLNERNIGVPVLDGYPPMELSDGRLDVHKCFRPSNGAYVSLDMQAIRLHGRNNNRLSMERDGVTLKYYDNSNRLRDGMRSFFRIPFAGGQCLPGFRYFCPWELLCPKSGGAVVIEPYQIEGENAKGVSEAMLELELDIAHVEGVDLEGIAIRIFDINPFPSSYGKTLTPMSRVIAGHLHRMFVASGSFEHGQQTSGPLKFHR